MARVFDCPNCGGTLRIETQGATTLCEYCGNTVPIPETLQIKPTPPPAPPPQVVYRERTVYVDAGEDEERSPEQKAVAWASVIGLTLMLMCLWLGLGSADDDRGTTGSSWPTETARPVAAFESQPVEDVISGQALVVAGRSIDVLSVALDNRAKVATFADWENYGDTITVANQRFAKIVIRQTWPVALDRAATDGVADETSLSALAALPLEIKLRLADGTVLTPSDSYAVPEDEVELGAGGPRQLVVSALFVIRRQRTLEGAVLLFTIDGREPFEIPLTAPLPEPVFPLTHTLPMRIEWPAPGGVLSYTLDAVSLDVESGFERAPAGQRYLTLPLTITNPSPEFSAAFESAMVRLRAGGNEYPALTASALTIGPGHAEPVTLTFLIPAGMPSVDLMLGNAARQFLSVSVGLPSDPLGVVVPVPSPTRAAGQTEVEATVDSATADGAQTPMPTVSAEAGATSSPTATP